MSQPGVGLRRRHQRGDAGLARRRRRGAAADRSRPSPRASSIASKRCSTARCHRELADHLQLLSTSSASTGVEPRPRLAHAVPRSDARVAAGADRRARAAAQPRGDLRARRRPPSDRRRPRVAGRRPRAAHAAAPSRYAVCWRCSRTRSGPRARAASCTRSAASRWCSASAIPNADLMFVGEAPGADEDQQGEPFVGRAGQLLTKIIEAIGLKRDDVYIANVIKCRPPGNRNPEPDEVEQCEPFLFRQIDAIKPKVIVALGKFAAQSLLQTTDPITRLRGRVFNYRGATLIPTFHPAYLLRNPVVQARGLGRHEEGARHPARRRLKSPPWPRGSCRWRCPSPRSTCSPTASRTRMPTAAAGRARRRAARPPHADRRRDRRGAAAGRRRSSCATSSRSSTTSAFLPADVAAAHRLGRRTTTSPGPAPTLAAAMPPHALDQPRRRLPHGSRRRSSPPKGTTSPSAGVGRAARSSRRLGTRQREAFVLLKGAPDGLTAPELAARGISAAVIARLQDDGPGHRSARTRVDRDPFALGGAALATTRRLPPTAR